MLIDTGASGVCIERGLLAPLGIIPSGQTMILTPSTVQPIPVFEYDVSLTVLHPGSSFNIQTHPILECQPLGGNIQGLLGRDILAYCLFLYHGHALSFSLAF